MTEDYKIFDLLGKYSKFAFYGAQVIAYGAYVAFNSLVKKKPECFIVSNMKNNPLEIESIPVKTIDSCGLDVNNTLIIVAVTEVFQEEICDSLKQFGFKNIYIYSAYDEFQLMQKYFSSLSLFPVLDYSENVTKMNVAVYETRYIGDKQLKTDFSLEKWEYPIQVGAALTDKRICEVADNTGENISLKNSYYCEMTAMYWIWKNTHHDMKGLCHYRRHLLINDEYIPENIDVILPLPYICYPNTLTQFRRFVSEDIVNCLLEVLKNLHPEMYDKHLNIFNGKYQYAYNIFVAKENVFNNYCEWIFEILDYMELRKFEVPDIAKPRVLGYISEYLTSLYFISNFNNLNIKHVNKKIYN